MRMQKRVAVALGALAAVVNVAGILFSQRLYATGSVFPDPSTGEIHLLDPKWHLFVTESDLTLQTALSVVGVALAMFAGALYFIGSDRGPST